MSEKSPSKDEAFEALDFIVNVLKEHEKDLDRLVSELGIVANQMGETGELNTKVKKIEDKINGLQNDLGRLVKYLSTSPSEAALPAANIPTANNSAKVSKTETPAPSLETDLPLILQCKHWEDFQGLAARAQTVSFSIKDSEKILEVDALKNNRVVSFNGEMPKLPTLLRLYLSKQLDVAERQVLEGDMALG
jgi:hypothetical protein